MVEGVLRRYIRVDTPNDLEQDGIAFAQPPRSRFLFDRVIQTSGDSAYSHHALCLTA
jgi:hypothetical protein